MIYSQAISASISLSRSRIKHHIQQKIVHHGLTSMRHEWLCTHDPDGSSSICNLSHPLQKLIRHMVFRSRFLHPVILERPLLVKVQPQENTISLFKFILIVVLVLLGFYTIMGQSENLLNLLKYLLYFLQEILNRQHSI